MNLLRSFRIAALMAISLLGAACASQPKPTFYWGSYQQGLYNAYKEPGDAAISSQIEALEKSIEQAKTNDLNLAPGLFAHLAYLYLQQGDAVLAKQYFESEAALYPESQVFMQRLISNLDGSSKESGQGDSDV